MVIDAHLHLWDTSRYRYEWLLRPGHESINRTYTFSDFAVRAAAAGVDRAVLVQAADDDTDTEAMFEVADAHDEIAGVVGWVPLDRPDVAAASLGRLRARPKFSGIRTLIHDQADPDWLLRPSVGEGLALLERYDVPFDVIAVLPRHLSQVPVLSQRYPGLRMVLDHLGHPPLDNDDWEPWRTLITEAAASSRVYAKLSGLYPAEGSPVRALVEFALELFGAERLMFGSDWPVAELGGGYQPVAGALLDIIGELPAPQREAILAGTATDFYGL